jgi:hypothetical protein
MAGRLVVSLAAALMCGLPLAAPAQERPANTAAAIAAKDLTREQFLALPPDAVIEINGESITKSALQARNLKAVTEALKRLPELRARADAIRRAAQGPARQASGGAGGSQQESRS